ncbi:DUF397 domain-containing protein [Nocardiopsis mangrovi]|uniref:DUF397 domain-containing protein n=1 Tax=Nocardiopsis mangrovi TaxID=1179818 RepID=A0ABV9E3F4_9ACTN
MPDFHKSTYSHAHGDCVEVAEGPKALVRDSRNRDAATLTVSAREWVALLADIDAF